MHGQAVSVSLTATNVPMSLVGAENVLFVCFTREGDPVSITLSEMTQNPVCGRVTFCGASDTWCGHTHSPGGQGDGDMARCRSVAPGHWRGSGRGGLCCFRCCV